MQTFFLGTEEVDAHMRDLSVRLFDSRKHNPPSVLLTIGPSGLELAYHLGKTDSQRWSGIPIVQCAYERKTRSFSFRDEAGAHADIPDADVLILDSAVHSGNTMRKAIDSVRALRPKAITTYSLVVKESASVVPNLFGLIIGRHDRAYFLLNRIPNMRIMRSGVLRPMEEKDIHAPAMKSGVASIDKFGWPELWYDANADSQRRTFVYEMSDKPVAFITFRHIEDARLLIDVLAVDKAATGRGVAENLVRWAETCARVSNCKRIVLWARKDQTDDLTKMYSKFGYEVVDGKVLVFSDESFFLMKKDCVYDAELDELLRID